MVPSLYTTEDFIFGIWYDLIVTILTQLVLGPTLTVIHLGIVSYRWQSFIIWLLVKFLYTMSTYWTKRVGNRFNLALIHLCHVSRDLDDVYSELDQSIMSEVLVLSSANKMKRYRDLRSPEMDLWDGGAHLWGHLTAGDRCVPLFGMCSQVM